MAKGDQGLARDLQGQTITQAQGQMKPIIDTASSAYQKAVPRQMGDYSNIMGRYNNMAQTGGYSPEDISNLRARGASPVRAAYSQAEQGIGRQRALQGGYSPNATATMAKMAREQSQAGSDAMTGVNANLAQMIQQGKLAGLQGGASLYGTTPGMANSFASQALGGAEGLANIQNAGVGNYTNLARLPTTFQNVMGGVGSIGNLVGGVAGGLSGLGGSNTSGWTNNEPIYH